MKPTTSSVLLAGGTAIMVSLGLGRAYVSYAVSPGRLEFSESSLTHTCRPILHGKAEGKEFVRFGFKNSGGRPVRITSVTSGCGCTVADVQPKVVGPGEAGFVEAAFRPLDVDVRDVAIQIQTDSPSATEKMLKLRIVGNRQPPYLYDVKANLFFGDEALRADPRTISVVMIEKDHAPAPPAVDCDLAFVKLVYDGCMSEPHLIEGTYKRSYSYKVYFSNDLPGEDFSGEVRIVRPRDDSVLRRIPIAGWPVPEITSIPARILITMGGGGDFASETFEVRTKVPMADFRAKVRGDSGAGISVELEKVSGDRRSASFRVWPKPVASGRKPLEQVDIEVVDNDRRVLRRKLLVRIASKA